MGSYHEGDLARPTGIYWHMEPQDASMSVIFGDGMGRDGCGSPVVGHGWTHLGSHAIRDKPSGFGFDMFQVFA